MIALVVIALLLSPARALFMNASEEEAFKQSKISQATTSSPHHLMRDNTVYLYLDIYKIAGVDENAGTVSLKIWLYVMYLLPHLAWNMTENNLDGIIVPKGTFWIPDIAPYDVQDITYQSNSDQALLHQGIVLATTSLYHGHITCSFDVTHFPYDRHSCPFTFGQWIYDNLTYHIDVMPVFGDLDSLQLEYFTESDQWKIRGPVTIEKGQRHWDRIGYYNTMTYHLEIERKPQFFVFVLLMPTIVLVLLSSLTFVLPVESGEKVSLGMTILLSQIVALLVLNDILPPSSANFPLLGVYTLITIILISVSIVIAVLVINLSFCTDRDLPVAFGRVIRSVNFMHAIGLKSLPRAPGTVPPHKVNPSPREAFNDRDVTDKDEETDEMVERRQKDWKCFGEVIDRVGLIIYSVLTGAVTAGFLLKIMIQ